MDALKIIDYVERRRNEGATLKQIKRELGTVEVENNE